MTPGVVTVRVRSAVLTLAMLAIAGIGSAGHAQSCERPCVGPPRGAIVAAGGGKLDPQIYERFVELAGGAE